MTTPRSAQMQKLTERLRTVEQPRRGGGGGIYSSRINALDALLPNGGFPSGALVEWLPDTDGCGATTLALAVASSMLRDAAMFFVIDPSGEFYPPALEDWGIRLEQVVLIRPRTTKTALWAFEQSLRSRGAFVALAQIDSTDDLVFRRLQLAAEQGGGLGFVLRSAKARRRPSWAYARFLVKSLPSPVLFSPSQGRRICLEVLHCRNGPSGGVMELVIENEANHLRVVSQLGSAARSKIDAGAGRSVG